MIFRIMKQSILIAVSAMLLVIFSPSGFATTVQVQTSLGDFEINLYDDTTPETVARFLEYVNDDSYSGSIMHRSVPGFIVQGGGFAFNGDQTPSTISNLGTIINEPVHANVRGTIAMAKLGGDPSSATRQWFINLSNNTGNLDGQNGGFTVFGQVTGNGMQIVDAMAALPRFDFGGTFTDLPLQDFANTGSNPTEDEYVIVNAVEVLDAAANTAQNLERPLNTGNQPDNGGGSNDGGGGAGFWLFILVGLLFVARVKKRAV